MSDNTTTPGGGNDEMNQSSQQQQEDGSQSAVAGGGRGGSFGLTIRLSSGTRFEVQMKIPASSTTATASALITVSDVKEKLSKAEETECCSVDRQRLIYKGRILEDARSLSDYGIVLGSTLFLVMTKSKTTGTIPANPSTPAVSSTAPATPASNSSDSIPRMDGGPPPPSIPANFFGFGGGGPSGSDGSGGNDFLRNMIQQQMENNPAMQELLRNNPALQHVLNDPGALDQAMQMMRNPAAMRQAMRNQDLALSQLENMPGGMAALQNMYNQYQQPLEDVLSPGGSSSGQQTTTTNPANNDAGASGRAMPNPWGSPSQQQASSQQRGSSSFGQRQTQGMSPMSNPFMSMFGGVPSGGVGESGGANPWASASPGAAGMMPPRRQGGPSQQEREMMLQMLDNPAMMQMMQGAYQQNPDMFRNMLMAQNPMLRNLFQNNPAGLDQWFQQMMNPNTVRAIMEMENSLRGMNLTVPPGSGGSQPFVPPTGSGGSGGLDFGSLLRNQMQSSQQGQQPQFMMPDFNAIFGGESAAGPGMMMPPWMGQPPMMQQQQQAQAPGDRYQRQLRSLYDMGFDDEVRCLAALEATSGNVNRAVDMLLSGSFPAQQQGPTITTTAASDSPTTVAAATTTAEIDNSNIATSDGASDSSELQPSEPKDPQDKKDD